KARRDSHAALVVCCEDRLLVMATGDGGATPPAADDCNDRLCSASVGHDKCGRDIAAELPSPPNMVLLLLLLLLTPLFRWRAAGSTAAPTVTDESVPTGRRSTKVAGT